MWVHIEEILHTSSSALAKTISRRLWHTHHSEATGFSINFLFWSLAVLDVLLEGSLAVVENCLPGVGKWHANFAGPGCKVAAAFEGAATLAPVPMEPTLELVV